MNFNLYTALLPEVYSLSFSSNCSKGITSFIGQRMVVGKEGRQGSLASCHGVYTGLPYTLAPEHDSINF